MPIVTVSDVRVLDLRRDVISEFVLSAPYPGTAIDSYAITFSGHVVTRDKVAHGLELRCKEQAPVWIPNALPRPDLGEAYPDFPWAATRSGFHAAVSVLPLPNEFSAELHLVTQEMERIPLAVITGRHESPPTSDSGMAPIMVTTLGRTGSTWVINLLSHHPDVVAYPAFKGEVRCATYWTDVMAALTSPASYLQGIRTQAAGNLWWLGNSRRFDEILDDHDIETWLGKGQVEEMVRFYKARLDEFYFHLAERTGRGTPRYFAEKALPSTQLAMLRHLYPGLKEVFLVRDFRDMLTSIFAFNRAKGFQSFGRELADSDEQYVRSFLGPDVDRLLRGWQERSDRAHLLRYEDLVNEPGPTLRALFSYLELDSSEPVIERILAASEERPSAQQQGHPTTATPADSLQRWRRDLSPELQAACDEAFSKALEGFGYELDSRRAAESPVSAT
jgi:hypothetical protein